MGEAGETASEEEWLRSMLGDLVKRKEGRPDEARKSDAVQMGEGLSPMPRRLVEKIQTGEFVEFPDFPVLDGGSGSAEPVDQDGGDRVVVVQANDKRRSKREVPDASWWGSCFTLYERAVLMAEPERGPELSAYREAIQKAARSYRWECVVKYDRQFRKAAAVDRTKSWVRVDPSLFLQELAGPQAAILAAGAWPASEPPGIRKRHRESGPGGTVGGSDSKRWSGTCHRFNRQDGACSYGAQCKFSHTCARCGGTHPGSRCSGPQPGWRSGQPSTIGPGLGRDERTHTCKGHTVHTYMQPVLCGTVKLVMLMGVIFNVFLKMS